MMFADETKLIIGQYEHVGQHKNKLMCLDTNTWKDKHQTVQKLFMVVDVMEGGNILNLYFDSSLKC